MPAPEVIQAPKVIRDDGRTPFLSPQPGVNATADEHLVTLQQMEDAIAAALTGGAQPLDATLTALAALATVADRLIYSTGADAFALTALGPFVRTDLLPCTSASAARTALGITDGTSWKESCRVATAANVDLSTALENGDTLNGVTLATGDRVLVWLQTTGSQNGIYVVQPSGAAVRATDMDAGSEFPGALVAVRTGSLHGDTVFVCTNDSVTLGTTAVVWSKHQDTMGLSALAYLGVIDPSVHIDYGEAPDRVCGSDGDGLPTLLRIGTGAGSLAWDDHVHVAGSLPSTPYAVDSEDGDPVRTVGASSTSEVVLWDYSVPGGTLGTNGKLSLILDADLYNESGVSVNCTVRVKYGSTTLWGDLTALPSSANRKLLTMRIDLSARGANNKQRISGTVALGEGAAGSVAGTGDLDTAQKVVAIAGTAAETSTSTLTFQVTVQYSASNAAHQARLFNARLLRVPA